MVVLFHAGLPLPGGFLGVDVFFVISGFVVTGALLREHARSGRIRLGAFYFRRFKRLTPALALTVAVVLLIAPLLLSPLGPLQNTQKTGLGAMLLAANAVIAQTSGGYFQPSAEFNALLNTWSLSVEEQFYLVFPLLLVVGLTLGLRSFTKLPTMLILFLTVVSLALALRGAQLPFLPEWLFGFYGPVSRAWEFGVGALLALAYARLSRVSIGLAQACGVLGLLMLAASLGISGETATFPGPLTLVPVIGTCLLLISGCHTATITTRLLATRPLVTVGDYSYSWYLWHWPMIVFAVALVGQSLVVTVAAAALSVIPTFVAYRLVEDPLRRADMPLRRRRAGFVAITVSVPLCLALVGLYVGSQSYWTDNVRRLEAAQAMHAGSSSGCLSDVPVTQRNLTTCTFNAGAPGKPIFLVGDSNADHLSEAAILAGEDLGRPVTIVNHPSCPLMDVYFLNPGGKDPRDCHGLQAETLAWLATQPSGDVIMSFADEYWTKDGYASGRDPDALSEDLASRRQALTDGLSTTMQVLAEAGHSSTIVLPIPHYTGVLPNFSYFDCSLLAVARGECFIEVPREEVTSVQRDYREAIAEAAEVAPATLVDLNNLVCNDATCSTLVGDTYMYMDGGHLSVDGSRAARTILRDAL